MVRQRLHLYLPSNSRVLQAVHPRSYRCHSKFKLYINDNIIIFKKIIHNTILEVDKCRQIHWLMNKRDMQISTWRVVFIEHCKWREHLGMRIIFWRVVFLEVFFEVPKAIWRALKTSILSTEMRDSASPVYRANSSWCGSGIYRSLTPTRYSSDRRIATTPEIRRLEVVNPVTGHCGPRCRDTWDSEGVGRWGGRLDRACEG